MSDFQIPDHWTAQQAELVADVLNELAEAIQSTYHSALRRLWQQRDQERRDPERPWCTRNLIPPDEESPDGP